MGHPVQQKTAHVAHNHSFVPEKQRERPEGASWGEILVLSAWLRKRLEEQAVERHADTKDFPTTVSGQVVLQLELGAVCVSVDVLHRYALGQGC